MTIGSSAIGSTPIGGSSQRVLDAIKASSDIPYSAREEIQEFIRNLEEEVLRTVENIYHWFETATKADMQSEIFQYLDTILEVIRSVL